MRALDWQVLEALYRASLDGDGELVDMTIHEEGERFFGKGWAGRPKYSQKFDYEYVSQISLSLGRLEKLGLVKSQKHAANSFKYWKLTSEGWKLARGMVAHEPV